jgi:hypothetical protein
LNVSGNFKGESQLGRCHGQATRISDGRRSVGNVPRAFAAQ